MYRSNPFRWLRFSLEAAVYLFQKERDSASFFLALIESFEYRHIPGHSLFAQAKTLPDSSRPDSIHVSSALRFPCSTCPFVQ
jgi:hypothetical protein